MSDVTHSRSKLPPTDWVEYVDAHTGELQHIDRYNRGYTTGAHHETPPGGWDHGEEI